jgi:hypothetical protein
MKTQKQLYEQERKKIADANKHVMEMIHCKKNPLTKGDLHLLADKFPQRWEKYRHLLDNIEEKPIIFSSISLTCRNKSFEIGDKNE